MRLSVVPVTPVGRAFVDNVSIRALVFSVCFRPRPLEQFAENHLPAVPGSYSHGAEPGREFVGFSPILGGALHYVGYCLMERRSVADV